MEKVKENLVVPKMNKYGQGYDDEIEGKREYEIYEQDSVDE